MIQALETAYNAHVGEVLLPFWAEAGFDRARGLFAERLDFDGRAIASVPHRAMVQARQIHVFSQAARAGIFKDGGTLAHAALANLIGRYLDDGDASRGFAFSIETSGRIVSAARDSYSHAFILLALASIHRLTGERRVQGLIDATDAFVERHLVDPADGGLFEAMPVSSTLKAQNPLMHLLEAYLALHETLPNGPWLGKATRIVDLFVSRLYSPSYKALAERFEANWTIPRNSAKAIFEPGHHFEWVWLLSWFDRLAGRDHSMFRGDLWRGALDHGVSTGGLCFDEVNFSHHPIKTSSRLWPHTEAIKAALIMSQDDCREGEGIATTMYNSLLDHFLRRPFAAGWIDHFDATGKALVDYVPSSSLYHLYGAMT